MDWLKSAKYKRLEAPLEEWQKNLYIIIEICLIHSFAWLNVPMRTISERAYHRNTKCYDQRPWFTPQNSKWMVYCCCMRMCMSTNDPYKCCSTLYESRPCETVLCWFGEGRIFAWQIIQWNQVWKHYLSRQPIVPMTKKYEGTEMLPIIDVQGSEVWHSGWRKKCYVLGQQWKTMRAKQLVGDAKM